MKKKVKFVIEKGNIGLDSPAILLSGLTIPPNPIQVLEGFDKSLVLGHATVTKENGMLVAEMELDEKHFDKIPSIGIKILKKDTDKKGNTKITSSSLLCVGLSKKENEDTSIRPISEQIK